MLRYQLLATLLLDALKAGDGMAFLNVWARMTDDQRIVSIELIGKALA